MNVKLFTAIVIVILTIALLLITAPVGAAWGASANITYGYGG